MNFIKHDGERSAHNGILSRSYNLTNTESNSYRREVAKRDEDEERERKEEGEEEEEGGKEVGSAISEEEEGVR